MSDERKVYPAPFANVWALDDSGEPVSPDDYEDIVTHALQNDLFDAGAYDDEQERFVKWGRE